MFQKILQINGKLTVSSEEFERDNGAESAQGLVNVPGLLWKIAYINQEAGEAGGFYLFSDEAALEDFHSQGVAAAIVRD